MSLLKTHQWLPTALKPGVLSLVHSLHRFTGPWFSAYFSGLLYDPLIALIPSFIKIVLVLLGECDSFSEAFNLTT